MTDRENAKIRYADIIGLPHRQSSKRRHMSLHDRAAQFAPFAALSGYDDMVAEEARLTDSEIRLSEYEMDMLNQKIRMLEDAIGRGGHPRVSLTFFKPDLRKDGGKYECVSGYVKKINRIDRKIVLFGSDHIDDKRVSPVEIDMDRIISYKSLIER